MLQTGTLGFPRIGKKRELKFALEAYWKGKISHLELLDVVRDLTKQTLLFQKSKSISFIATNDMSLYDHVLDLSLALGVIPKRFQKESFLSSVDLMFAIARGTQEHTASEMTKWFNTNYHYIVPEFDSPLAPPVSSFIVDRVRQARELGIHQRPVILGLMTYIFLGKNRTCSLADCVDMLLPRYLDLLGYIVNEGVEWIQMDEPFLVIERSEEELSLYERILYAIKERFPDLKVFLQTYFESIAPNYERVIAFPVDGIGLDFTVSDENMTLLAKRGFPEDKVLGVGLIDGRNIWKSNLLEKIKIVEELLTDIPDYHLVLQPSCSLQFVPVSLEVEKNLDSDVKSWLAFAEEKLDELAILQSYFNEGKQKVALLIDDNKKVLDGRRTSSKIFKKSVRKRVHDVEGKDFYRSVPFSERKILQQERLCLPVLPTTTIGSFPQTDEVRSVRQRFRQGKISPEEYVSAIKRFIRHCVKVQEEIGLDVLVHGEFERNDMVEYFGEHLEGFIFTGYGWVQSYGSRCVKPPIIYGDVARPESITTEIIKYAASLTSKPMKGMLTGPVTILGWSFVRDDQPLEETCLQIALALREEVLDLEEAGIKIIQIDEAALRERLPLRKEKQEHYLSWAVRCFRATCSDVSPETQIHTHMCYSHFNDIISAISAMDTDCISIENSRSDMELLEVFHDFHYKNDIGLGVYDIHSPRVPSLDEIKGIIEASLSVIPKEQFWVNPDCGLKTRNWEEVIPSLKTMVEAAKMLR